MEESLKLLVLENMKEFGNAVSKHLCERQIGNDILISISNQRFSNGEGKVMLANDISDKDIFILTDIGNYGITYSIHGVELPMTPDEHFQDIKRVISACSGRAKSISVIMPLLYESRQHKRKNGESLDCAIALQELENLGVNRIITFDAHDPSVANAIPLLPFENIYPTHVILDTFLQLEHVDSNRLLVISPDMGATERARYYAEMLGCDVGVFYKRRDLSKIVNGKNPIVEHVYLGTDVKGKNVLVTDDMIASGESLLGLAKELKKRGASSVYLVATFALFTEGYRRVLESYEKGYFDKLYATNLSYVPDEIKSQPWYVSVDMTQYAADVIASFYHKENAFQKTIKR